ncbi:hypothetical protein PNOK_0490500 [Pyrrhoderma noxium]|uniref:Uncharacterized protein n=1 Tax=Pyrrhoderma noxium TaxID=2282107 RepID=A0A286UK24_9AGAM|nr:hypothetical protein PNOK_0490500 [Pyrrhoderma noxium]
MLTVTVDISYLIGGWLASSLWGIYTIMFYVFIYFTVTKRPRELWKTATWLLCSMYILTSGHLFIALYRMVSALDALKLGADMANKYLFDVTIPINRGKDIVYIIILLLGDIILTWRCFVVWGYNLWVVICPALLILTTTITGFISNSFLFHPQSLNVKTMRIWATAMFSSSVATNIIVTLLTAGRIWWLVKPHGSFTIRPQDRTYLRIIFLILDSGAFVTAGKLCELILLVTDGRQVSGSHPIYIIFEMMPQITGMVPTLMLALVHSELISSSASSTDPSVVDTAPTFLDFWVQNTGDTSTTNVEGQTSTEFSQQKASTKEIKDVHLVKRVTLVVTLNDGETVVFMDGGYITMGTSGFFTPPTCRTHILVGADRCW